MSGAVVMECRKSRGFVWAQADPNPIKLLVTTFDNSNTYWNCHFMHINEP